jgi:hypothetical protein
LNDLAPPRAAFVLDEEQLAVLKLAIGGVDDCILTPSQVWLRGFPIKGAVSKKHPLNP